MNTHVKDSQTERARAADHPSQAVVEKIGEIELAMLRPLGAGHVRDVLVEPRMTVGEAAHRQRAERERDGGAVVVREARPEARA